MTTHYFAADGNYGDASGILIVHSDHFTEEEWEEIDTSHDSTRVEVVTELLKRKHNVVPLRVNGL